MNDVPRILIVDDEAVNLAILHRTLVEAGFGVLSASSGAEAFESAVRHKPDLIILDILMPGEDGFAVCQRLQASPEAGDIPVIFVSGLADSSDKVRGLETGAVDYITKPFSRQEVLARVRIHLRLRRARQALIEAQAARLSTIRQAQQALLADPAALPEARFAVRFLPVHEAGGDIYDVFPQSGNTFAYFVADVTGHDLGASFWTPAVKTLLRQNAGPIYAPAETFSTMNGVLLEVLAPGQFLTAAYLALNRAAGQAVVVRAGHPAPVLMRAGGASVLDPEGDILGAFPNVSFEARKVRVHPGDRFYLYTDGLLEQGGRSQDAGREMLLEACARTASLALDDSLRSILDQMAVAGEPSDDVVLLGVEV